MNMNLVISDLEISNDLDRTAMVDLIGRGTTYGSWYNVGSAQYISGSYRQGAYSIYNHVKLFGQSIYLEKRRYDSRWVKTKQRRRVTYKKWF